MTYPIGVPGKPWGEAERDLWRAAQRRHRSYADDVLSRVDALGDRFERIGYGELDYAGEQFELVALRSRIIDPGLPSAFITGGVHGYETSGVAGALAFLEGRADDYEGRANLLVAPCVSPWAYERINRWTFDAVDPNRNFRLDGPAPESIALIGLARAYPEPFALHIDLHETTDSDADEFTPALAARDGKPFERDVIPDGFYLVADSERPQLLFQQAIINAVRQVVPIAPPSEKGTIIGCPPLAPGVIAYPLKELGLCASITGATYTTTTEVYPDSAEVSPDDCVRAQVTAVCAALDFVLGKRQIV